MRVDPEPGAMETRLSGYFHDLFSKNDRLQRTSLLEREDEIMRNARLRQALKVAEPRCWFAVFASSGGMGEKTLGEDLHQRAIAKFEPKAEDRTPLSKI